MHLAVCAPRAIANALRKKLRQLHPLGGRACWELCNHSCPTPEGRARTPKVLPSCTNWVKDFLNLTARIGHRIMDALTQMMRSPPIPKQLPGRIAKDHRLQRPDGGAAARARRIGMPMPLPWDSAHLTTRSPAHSRPGPAHLDGGQARRGIAAKITREMGRLLSQIDPTRPVDMHMRLGRFCAGNRRELNRSALGGSRLTLRMTEYVSCAVSIRGPSFELLLHRPVRV